MNQGLQNLTLQYFFANPHKYLKKFQLSQILIVHLQSVLQREITNCIIPSNTFIRRQIYNMYGRSISKKHKKILRVGLSRLFY